MSKPSERQRKLYDNALLISLRAPGYSGRKTDDRIQKAAADHLGIMPGDLSGSKVLVPAHYLKQITAPVAVARFNLKRLGVPWTSNKSDLRGNRKEDGKWLVYTGSLPELEKVLSECKAAREKAVKYFLDRYDDVIAAQMVSLGPLFRQEDYLTRDELQDRFSWTVEITPLWSLANVEDDLRLKLPASWAEDQVKVARQEEGKRISNAVAAAAGEVVAFVTETVEKLRSYDPDAMLKDCTDCDPRMPSKKCKKCEGTGQVEDKRVGNTFRDKTLYKSVPALRERLTYLNEMLGDKALSETIESLAGVEDLLDGTTGDQVRKDKATRDSVADAMEGVAETVRPATDRIGELFA
jgi:hypothetical protein